MGGESTEEQIKRISKTENFYDVLNVAKDSTESQIKKAYRTLALQVHPDKCQLPGAEDTFKKVSTAYSCLSDPNQRARYDRSGCDKSSVNNNSHSNVDAEELFRQFMEKHPEFKAGLEAGIEPGTDINISLEWIRANWSKLNLSQAALTTGWELWEIRMKGKPKLVRSVSRAIGLVIYFLLYLVVLTMPVSGWVLGTWAVLGGIVVGWRSFWWLLSNFVWVFACGYLPEFIRPRILFRCVLILATQWYLGSEVFAAQFGFQRGLGVWIFLVLLNSMLGGGNANTNSPGGGFTFTFSTGSSGSGQSGAAGDRPSRTERRRRQREQLS